RMRSMSVPCGTRSTSIFFAIICRCVSGLRPMWLATVRLTNPASTSLPMPRPGSALSFAITVRLRLPWRTSSSITRSGDPTPIKPPIMRVAPSGIMATASFNGMVCMAGLRSSSPFDKSRPMRPCAENAVGLDSGPAHGEIRDRFYRARNDRAKRPDRKELYDQHDQQQSEHRTDEAEVRRVLGYEHWQPGEYRPDFFGNPIERDHFRASGDPRRHQPL